MSEEKRPEAETPAEESSAKPVAEEATVSTAAPEEAPLPAEEAEEAIVTPEPAIHPVAQAAAAPGAAVETPATVAEPIPAAAPSRPRRQWQPQPDTGKKIGPFSASMWFMGISVGAFVLALFSLLF